MGGDQDCAVVFVSQVAQKVRERILGLAVERRAEFVEQEDRGVEVESAREGEALAAGEIGADPGKVGEKRGIISMAIANYRLASSS